MCTKSESIFPVSSRYLDPSKSWPPILIRVSPDVTDTLESLAANRSDTEQVGILGMRRTEGLLTHIYLDTDAQCSCASAQLTGQKLTVVAQQWQDTEDVIFAGIFHTHPNGLQTLSQQDLAYARQVLSENKMQTLLMVLITPEKALFYAVDQTLQ